MVFCGLVTCYVAPFQSLFLIGVCVIITGFVVFIFTHEPIQKVFKTIESKDRIDEVYLFRAKCSGIRQIEFKADTQKQENIFISYYEKSSLNQLNESEIEIKNKTLFEFERWFFSYSIREIIGLEADNREKEEAKKWYLEIINLSHSTKEDEKFKGNANVSYSVEYNKKPLPQEQKLEQHY